MNSENFDKNKFLLDSLESTNDPKQEAEKDVQYSEKHGEKEYAEKIKNGLTNYNHRYEILIKSINSLRENLHLYSQEEFDNQLKRLENLKINISKKFHSYNYPYWHRIPNEYPSYYTTYEDIDSADTFREKRAMQWEPERQDIALILATAIKSHELNPNKSNKIKIVEVGGANGLLAKLIKDFAIENKLELDYTIVDPDKDITKQATEYFNSKDEYKNINIISEPIEKYTQALYTQNPELNKRLSDLIETSKESDTNQRYLYMLTSLYHEIKNSDIAKNSLEKIKDIFKKTYDFDITDEDAPDILFMLNQDKTKAIFQELETKTENNSDIDLVINSWMPPEVDLTPWIRLLNSQSICYALAADGSTGVYRNDGEFYVPNKSHEIFAPRLSSVEDESYQTGSNYENSFGWTTDQINYKDANGMVIQSKEKLDSDAIIQNSKNLKTPPPYPWEPTTANQRNIINLDQEQKTPNTFRKLLWPDPKKNFNR